MTGEALDMREYTYTPDSSPMMMYVPFSLLLNQAIFAKFKLYGDDDLTVESQLVSPFEEILIIGNKKGQKNSYSTLSVFFSLKSSSKNLLERNVNFDTMLPCVTLWGKVTL